MMTRRRRRRRKRTGKNGRMLEHGIQRVITRTLTIRVIGQHLPLCKFLLETLSLFHC
jgi:hypothetical protein